MQREYYTLNIMEFEFKPDTIIYSTNDRPKPGSYYGAGVTIGVNDQEGEVEVCMLRSDPFTTTKNCPKCPAREHLPAAIV